MAKNVWYIASRTVPLMAVAGIMGAVVSHVIPLDALVNAKGVGAILLVALCGTFLPVPIAFDVILTNALFTAGLPPELCLILLCTLGIFSAYSFMIVWTSASRQWAMSLAGVAIVLGITIGLTGEFFHKTLYIEHNIAKYEAAANIVTRGERLGASPESTPSSSEAPSLSLTQLFEDDKSIVSRYGERSSSGKNNSGQFHKMEGGAIGLDRGFVYGIRDYPDPFLDWQRNRSRRLQS